MNDLDAIAELRVRVTDRDSAALEALDYIAERLRGEAAPEGRAVGCEECAGSGEVVEYIDPYQRGDVSSPVRKPCPDCVQQSAAPDGGVLTALQECRDKRQAAPAPVAGWLQAVDTELVNAHLGVADPHDSFETAQRKLSELIQWHIDVSHDPRVNGAPVAGDAVDLLPEKWRWRAEGYENPERARIERCADDLESALAQDRASQAGADGGVA